MFEETIVAQACSQGDLATLIRWLRYISVECDECGLHAASSHCSAAAEAVKRSLLDPADRDHAFD